MEPDAPTWRTTEDERNAVRGPRVQESAPAWLFRLLECESTAALPARSCLRGVQAVASGRRSSRGGEVQGDRLQLFVPDR